VHVTDETIPLEALLTLLQSSDPQSVEQAIELILTLDDGALYGWLFDKLRVQTLESGACELDVSAVALQLCTANRHALAIILRLAPSLPADLASEKGIANIHHLQINACREAFDPSALRHWSAPKSLTICCATLTSPDVNPQPHAWLPPKVKTLALSDCRLQADDAGRWIAPDNAHQLIELSLHDVRNFKTLDLQKFANLQRLYLRRISGLHFIVPLNRLTALSDFSMKYCLRLDAPICEALTHNPITEFHARVTRAIVAYDAGRYKESLAECDRARALGEDGDLYLHRGGSLMALQRYEEAAADFTKATDFDIETQAGEYFCRFNHAFCLSKLGNVEDALAAYREVAKRFPRDAEVWIRIARLLSKQGRFDESVQVFTHVIEQRLGQESLAYNSRSVRLLQLGRLEEALVDAQRAVFTEKQKLAPMTLFDRCLAHLAVGNATLAELDVQCTALLDPEGKIFDDYVWLGFASESQGKALLSSAQAGSIPRHEIVNAWDRVLNGGDHYDELATELLKYDPELLGTDYVVNGLSRKARIYGFFTVPPYGAPEQASIVRDVQFRLWSKQRDTLPKCHALIESLIIQGGILDVSAVDCPQLRALWVENCEFIVPDDAPLTTFEHLETLGFESVYNTFSIASTLRAAQGSLRIVHFKHIDCAELIWQALSELVALETLDLRDCDLDDYHQLELFIDSPSLKQIYLADTVLEVPDALSSRVIYDDFPSMLDV